jgi:hypothetical protein
MAVFYLLHLHTELQQPALQPESLNRSTHAEC